MQFVKLAIYFAVLVLLVIHGVNAIDRFLSNSFTLRSFFEDQVDFFSDMARIGPGFTFGLAINTSINILGIILLSIDAAYKELSYRVEWIMWNCRKTRSSRGPKRKEDSLFKGIIIISILEIVCLFALTYSQLV